MVHWRVQTTSILILNCFPSKLPTLARFERPLPAIFINEISKVEMLWDATVPRHMGPCLNGPHRASKGNVTCERAHMDLKPGNTPKDIQMESTVRSHGSNQHKLSSMFKKKDRVSSVNIFLWLIFSTKPVDIHVCHSFIYFSCTKCIWSSSNATSVSSAQVTWFGLSCLRTRRDVLAKAVSMWAFGIANEQKLQMRKFCKLSNCFTIYQVDKSRAQVRQVGWNHSTTSRANLWNLSPKTRRSCVPDRMKWMKIGKNRKVNWVKCWFLPVSESLISTRPSYTNTLGICVSMAGGRPDFWWNHWSHQPRKADEIPHWDENVQNVYKTSQWDSSLWDLLM